MNIKEIINKKQKDLALSHKEIEFAIMGYVNGSISKQDMTIFLKSVYNHGLCEEETFYLNDVMLNSGKILSFSDQKGVFADKHTQPVALATLQR